MLPVSVTPPPGPWSYPINQVECVGDLEVSLLSLSVVGEVVRVAGAINVRDRLDLRLERMPELRLHAEDGPPLVSIGAHLLPQAGTAWMQWLYARPTQLPVAYVAGIPRIDLVYRAGRIADGEHIGPVRFRFRIDRDDPRPAADGGERA